MYANVFVGRAEQRGEEPILVASRDVAKDGASDIRYDVLKDIDSPLRNVLI